MYDRQRPRGVFARIRGFIRRRPYVSGIGAATIVGLGLYLFFGFFAFHLLFVDSEVDEANPFAADDTALVSEQAEEPGPTTAEPAAGTTSTTAAAETNSAEITVLAEGTFVDLAHPTVGTARIITDGGQRFLRFEGFETDNGPDLNVYLAAEPADQSPVDFIDLGDLKGNIGAQNYELSSDIDLDRYSTVFIWCVRFHVGFGAAELA